MTQARIKFKKKGNAKYISHLDLNRCMSRALRRAGIPVWYTQGFNPHPYITFALPLSLGFESECEFMDIKLESDMDYDAIKEKLARQMPQGIVITGVYKPVMKPSQIAFAEFEIMLYPENGSNYDAGSLISLARVTITKLTKSGERETDITGILKSADIKQEGGGLFIHAVLPASPNNNVNPSCFAKAFEKYQSVCTEYGSYTRVNIYNESMEPFR